MPQPKPEQIEASEVERLIALPEHGERETADQRHIEPLLRTLDGYSTRCWSAAAAWRGLSVSCWASADYLLCGSYRETTFRVPG